MNDQQRDAIVLTLGKDFLDNWYPGGRDAVRKAIERCDEGNYQWMQFCGSGLPSVAVEFCYLMFDGKVQYRLSVEEYQAKVTGGFADGGVLRRFKSKNLVVMSGPVIKAPYDIPMKGFQGFRYTELIF